MPPSLGPSPAKGNAQHDLSRSLDLLERLYGPCVAPPAQGPFEMILWENVAYLASDTARTEAFLALRRRVGTKAESLLAADPKILREVARGILPGQQVGKLLEAAQIAMRELGGDLGPVLRRPAPLAKKALRMFPGIGEPGAEKILLFCGALPVLALDSNGLRVLLRLGFGEEKKSYAATYRSVQEAAGRTLPPRVGPLSRAHLLLRRHGQELCRRRAPRCGECPLYDHCAFTRSARAQRTPARRLGR